MGAAHRSTVARSPCLLWPLELCVPTFSTLVPARRLGSDPAACDPALLRQVSGPVAAVIADRTYDADAFIERVRARGGLPVVPPRRGRRLPRRWSRRLYGRRHR